MIVRKQQMYKEITYDTVKNTLYNTENAINFWNLLRNVYYGGWFYNTFIGPDLVDMNEVGNLSLDLITLDMTSSKDIELVINFVHDLKKPRQDIIKICHELLPKNINLIKSKNIIDLIKSITKITYENKSDVLLTVAMFECSKNVTALIDTINTVMIHIPDHKIVQNIVIYLKGIISPTLLSSNSTINILLTLSKIPNAKTQWRYLLDQTLEIFQKPLVTSTIDNFHLVLEALSNESRESEEILKLATYFLKPISDNNANIEFFVAVINRINKIPNNRTRIGLITNNRFNMVARALLFTRHMDHSYTNNDYKSRICEALECKPYDEITIGGMNKIAENIKNPYTVGVNIHSKNRDKNTLYAIQSLINIWNPTSEEIMEEFDRFWIELIGNEDEIQKEKILDALGWNIDQTPRKKKVGFEGLMKTDSNGHIAGFNIKITPFELLARFWHFADTYIPNTNENILEESNNIKKSILSNLADSSETDFVNNSSRVVCNEGKIQRLAVSILQGRLIGIDGKIIDIDELNLIPVNTNIMKKDGYKLKNQIQTIDNLEEISQCLMPFISQLNTKYNTHTQANTQTNIQKNTNVGIYTGINEVQRDNELPISCNEFLRLLFCYVDNLSKGNIIGFPPIQLDMHEVIYYIRMMTVTGIGNNLEINPDMSIISTYSELLNYTDTFEVTDYLRYFGEHDVKLLSLVKK